MEAAKLLKICRLCATNGPNFRAIFNGQNEKNEIGEKISKCLPILISSDDELPGHICSMCLRSLNTSYKLLMKVIETDEKLRQQLSQSRINKNQQDCEPMTYGFYEINFVDTGAFASNVETVHQSLLVCNLCHNSFDNPDELRQHKHKMHDNIDNPDGEDCHDSAIVEIKDEGILVSQDSNTESSASKKTIGKTVSKKMDDIIEEDVVVSVDSVTPNKSLLDAKALEDHQNTHFRKEPWSCGTCAKGFRTYAACSIHEQSHKEKREYICNLCQRSYKEERFLKRHMLNHLPPEKWDFECEICKFKFKRSMHLQQHMRVHSADHPYKCDICGAAYRRECELAKHKKRHLFAEIDKKKKKQSSQLSDKNNRIHKLKSDKTSDDIGKSQLIVCSLCGMSVSDADAFSSHMETIHQSEWICILCKNSFATFDELVQHKRETHSDDIDDADGKNCQEFDAIRIKKERRSISEDCEKPASLTDQQSSRELGGSHRVEDQDAGAFEVKKERTSVSEDCEEPASLADQQPSQNLRKRKLVKDHQNVQNFQLIPQSSEGEYSCETCHRKFKTLAARSGHQRIHIGVGHDYYTCDYCLKKFTRRYNLVRHMTVHLGPPEGLFKCEVCGSSFEGVSQLKDHMKVHTEKRIHECDICGIRFRRKHDMLRHRSCHRDKKINRKQQQQLSLSNDDDDQQNSEQKSQDLSDEAEKGESLMCGLSEISFVNVSTFDSPIGTFHQSKWACNLCQNSFATSEELRQHKYKTHYSNIDEAGGDKYKDFVALDDETLESQHSESKPPAPKEKTLKFKTSSARFSHEQAHGIATQYTDHTCDYCQRNFRYKYALRRHIRGHMPKYECETCFKRFHFRRNLMTHQKRQMGLICQQCSMEFADLCSLTAHLKKVHDMSIPVGGKFACKQCPKRFPKLRLLQDHQNIHSRKEPYRCETCDKTFRTYAAKWAHEQNHKKEGYICDYCQSSFKNKQHLIRHIQLHLPPELWKYECKICQAKFKRPANLQDHMRSHSPNVNHPVYKCDICEAQFRHKGSMLNHRKRHPESA